MTDNEQKPARLTVAEGQSIEYYNKPLETWNFHELEAALGPKRTAEVLGVSRHNARMMRHRGAVNVDRMQKLQAEVRTDEQKYRGALVTIHASGAFHSRG